MKLAEALQERADLNRNIEQLQSRLNNASTRPIAKLLSTEKA